MDKKPEALVRLDAEEFARLEADSPEHEAQAEREEQARREVLEKAWREQEAYTSAVAELKDKTDRRASLRVLAIAAAILLGAGALGVFLYSPQPVQDPMSEAEALRIASEARQSRASLCNPGEQIVPQHSRITTCNHQIPVSLPASHTFPDPST